MDRIAFSKSIQDCSIEDTIKNYFTVVMFLYNILDGAYDVLISKSSDKSFLLIFKTETEASNIHRIMNGRNVTLHDTSYIFGSILDGKNLEIEFNQNE